MRYKYLILLFISFALWVSCKKENPVPEKEDDKKLIVNHIHVTGNIYNVCNLAPGINFELYYGRNGILGYTHSDSAGNYVIDFIDSVYVNQTAAIPAYSYWVNIAGSPYPVWTNINTSGNTPHLSTYQNDVIDFNFRKKNQVTISIEIDNPSTTGDNYAEFEKCQDWGAPPNNFCLQYYRDTLVDYFYGEGYYVFSYIVVRDTNIQYHTDSVYVDCANDGYYHFIR